jgi:transposase
MIYSTDLRERVIAFIESGGKKLEASRRFNVCRPTIDKWLLLKKETGSLEAPPCHQDPEGNSIQKIF